MNKVIMTVTLGADPKISKISEDKSVVNFSGAVNKRYVKEGEPSADWFNFTAFGKTADFIGKYFKKGSQMLVTGEVVNNNYEKNGEKVYGTKIIIDTVEFFGKKAEGQTAETDAPAPAAEAKGGEYLDF